jgi:hypothetical protein
MSYITKIIKIYYSVHFEGDEVYQTRKEENLLGDIS